VAACEQELVKALKPLPGMEAAFKVYGCAGLKSEKSSRKD